MAVKIRLSRGGSKNKPFYRVVIADSRMPRDGRFIEIIGQYDPRQEPSFVKIDEERALSWLSQGAKPTNTVEKLLKIANIALPTKKVEKKVESKEKLPEEKVTAKKAPAKKTTSAKKTVGVKKPSKSKASTKAKPVEKE